MNHKDYKAIYDETVNKVVTPKVKKLQDDISYFFNTDYLERSLFPKREYEPEILGLNSKSFPKIGFEKQLLELDKWLNEYYQKKLKLIDFSKKIKSYEDPCLKSKDGESWRCSCCNFKHPCNKSRCICCSAEARERFVNKKIKELKEQLTNGSFVGDSLKNLTQSINELIKYIESCCGYFVPIFEVDHSDLKSLYISLQKIERIQERFYHKLYDNLLRDCLEEGAKGGAPWDLESLLVFLCSSFYSIENLFFTARKYRDRVNNLVKEFGAYLDFNLNE